jgi:hypothetical protein
MNRQPVFVRRTVNGEAYWISVPTIIVRLAVWAALLFPVLLVALLVQVLT